MRLMGRAGLAVVVFFTGSCAGEPSSPPSPTAPPSGVAVAAPPATLGVPTVAPIRVAQRCRTPAGSTFLDGPSREAESDLDLQFEWRAATVCQDLHELEHDAGFRPLENVVVSEGQGHRTLLLLPSLGGAVSIARYRVRLSDTVDTELVAAVAVERSAAAKSDGVDIAVIVDEAEQPAAPLDSSFVRLPGGQTGAAWRDLRIDLSPYRGRTVWVALAAREKGDRSGDWLLWGDPRIVVKQPPELRIEVGGTDTGEVRTLRDAPWSEVNVFKAYSGFNEDQRSTDGDEGWLRNGVSWVFPWVKSLRLFSSLGANWGPTLARDYASQMGHNPTRDSSEEMHWAEYYDFFRDGPAWAGTPVAKRFAWRRFDALLSRIAATGAKLHVNLSGAPELFTGGQGHYHTYHYNELPVVDEAGWKSYVGEVFRHLSRQPWYDRARFSFFSEPNCIWVASDGSVKHFGYQGDAAQYARQYLWTWQAMKPWVRPGQVHLGPFVVEPDPAVPEANNLPEFLSALREEFARSGAPLPPWSGFAFNIYESPQLAIDHFPSYKIDYVRRTLSEELPGVDLPLRFDEVGIHPLISSAFADAGTPSFDGSRWAAAWHMEMLALLVEQRIATAGPWLFTLMQRPYASYVLGSLATSLFAEDATQAGLRIRRRAGAADANVHVRLGSRSADRVGYLWSTSKHDETTRLAVWHIPRFPANDQRLVDDATEAPVTVHVPGCERTRCEVVVIGYDDQSFRMGSEPVHGAIERVRLAAIPELPRLRRMSVDMDGRLRLVLRSGEVYLLDIEATGRAAATKGRHAHPSLHAGR